MKITVLVASICSLLTTDVSAFGVFTKTAAAPKTLQTTDEAVGIYLTKFPKKTGQKRSINASWGMPVADIDGTKFTIAKPDDKSLGKTFSDVDEANLRATYVELCKVYGEDVAFQMVNDEPIILAAKRENFQPSLDGFSSVHGDEEARAMVARNPGLLFVKPKAAADPEGADTTMKMSYLVAATRPVGAYLLYGTLALLCEPALEKLSGVPLRSMIFSSF